MGLIGLHHSYGSWHLYILPFSFRFLNLLCCFTLVYEGHRSALFQLLSVWSYVEFDTSIICHVLVHCFGSFLLQDMVCFWGTKYDVYCEHVAYLHSILWHRAQLWLELIASQFFQWAPTADESVGYFAQRSRLLFSPKFKKVKKDSLKLSSKIRLIVKSLRWICIYFLPQFQNNYQKIGPSCTFTMHYDRK